MTTSPEVGDLTPGASDRGVVPDDDYPTEWLPPAQRALVAEARRSVETLDSRLDELPESELLDTVSRAMARRKGA